MACIIIGITFFTAGFIYEFHYPKLKQWVKTRIYLESYDNLPVLIELDNLELSPFTLSAQLQNVTLTPKKDLSKHISPVKIKSVDIRVSLISLLLGRFEISRVLIDQPIMSLIYKQKKNAAPFEMPDIDFNTLLKLPVDELQITDGQLLARLEHINQSIYINPVNLNLHKGFTSIFLELDLPEIKLKEKNNKDSLTAFGIYTKLSVSSRGTKLVDFKIKKDDSFAVAKGEASGNPLKLEFKTPTLLSSWNIKLDTIKESVTAYQKNIKLPEMSGIFEGSINMVGAQMNNFTLNSKLTNFTINKFDIGEVVINGTLDNKIVQMDVIAKNQLQNIEVSKLKLYLDEHYSFEGNLNIKSFELKQFLSQLNVNGAPLKLQASGNFPCSGVLLPKFYSNCEGDMTVSDFYVHGSNPKKNIVAVKNFKAKGTLHVNTKFILMDAGLRLASSTGKANARVDFLSGYKVNYSSDNFNIEDIQEIAGLSISGKTKISGSSEGSTEKGIFNIQINAQNAHFEKFYLGNLNTNLSYASPYLKLDNIEGNIETTSYSGQLGINFNHDTLDLNVSTTSLNLSHLPKILENRIHVPIKLAGSGGLQARIYGPLRIDKLNYDIKGQLQRVLIGKESVDFIKLNSNSANGIIGLTGTELTKSRSKVVLSGGIATDGKMDVTVVGTDIRLEESETLRSFTQNLNATMNLNGKLKGRINKPDIEAQLQIKQSNIGSTYYKGGVIEFSGTKDSGITRVKLFNDQLVGNVQWNYDTKTPLLIEAVFNNWDYSPIFSLFSAKNEREGYKANLNGKTFIQYDLNNFMNSKVSLDIYKLLLSRGILEIKNKENMQLLYDKNGLILRNFELEGNNSRIVWTANDSKAREISVKGRGHINLALLSFLTPFLNDVRGLFTFQSNITINSKSFEALGTAKVTEGFAKLNDFPVPFEKIDADFSFSQNRIAINRFRSEFGGGLIRGSGNISINGVQNIPVRIESVVDNANIQLSKGLELLTSGNLILSGNWFPYILKGNLDVKKGLISQDNTETKYKIRKSYLLPDVLKKQEVNPIELDISASLIGRNIKVINEFVNTSIAGRLQITGNPTKPTLTGNITQADKGFIQFNENRFDIDNMNVIFDHDQSMNPSLYVLANTRVKEYDVTMTVGGTLQDIQPSFTSQPPLNEADIITLLTLGYTQAALADEQGDNAGSGNAIGLGSAIINRNPLNKEIEDKTGISLRFNSAVDSSDENITVPKVEVSKKWGSRLETKASRTFGKTLKNDAKVQYKINDKVSVIGSWEYENSTDNSEFNNADKEDVFGVDLEYKIEFK